MGVMVYVESPNHTEELTHYLSYTMWNLVRARIAEEIVSGMETLYNDHTKAFATGNADLERAAYSAIVDHTNWQSHRAVGNLLAQPDTDGRLSAKDCNDIVEDFAGKSRFSPSGHPCGDHVNHHTLRVYRLIVNCAERGGELVWK